MTELYTVAGMTCEHCVARVQTALSSVSGVTSAVVSLLPPRVVVEGDDVDLAALNAALAGTSFSLTQPPVVNTGGVKPKR